MDTKLACRRRTLAVVAFQRHVQERWLDHFQQLVIQSTGEVRVRAFEEAHAFSGSSLHLGALAEEPDLSAFAYAAARLPAEMLEVELVILGQSHELFEAAGYDVRRWNIVKTRGRRRPLDRP